jgi:3-oxoisoapionate decarboxylase
METADEPPVHGSGPRRRIGIDSYAYHRLLGEVRPGETDPGRRFERGSVDVLSHARELRVDAVLLQTVFLGPPALFVPEDILAEADGLTVGLSWGAPDGFAFGDRPDALEDLGCWIDHAQSLGLPWLRIVAGGPHDRGRPIEPLVPLLREACKVARGAGLRLAVENHADLRADGLERLLVAVDDEALGVCFDAANALRVGDDVAASARRLAAAVVALHVKDCAGDWDDPAAGPSSVAPGTGVVPLDDVLAACPEALACAELGQLAPGADELALVAATVDYIRSR